MSYRADNGYYGYVNDTIQESYVQSFTIDDTTVQEISALWFPTLTEYDGGGLTATNPIVHFDLMVGNIPPEGLVLMEDEIIRYTGVTFAAVGVGDLTGCLRGALGSTKATHVNDTKMFFGSAFATIALGINAAAVTIQFSGLSKEDSLPETGVVQIRDAATNNEYVLYGGLIYSNAEKTAGYLTNCSRAYQGAPAAAVHAAGVALIFERRFFRREVATIYNNIATNVKLWVGHNLSLTNAGVNGVPILYGQSESFWLGSDPRFYVILEARGGSGNITIAEWR